MNIFIGWILVGIGALAFFMVNTAVRRWSLGLLFILSGTWIVFVNLFRLKTLFCHSLSARSYSQMLCQPQDFKVVRIKRLRERVYLYRPPLYKFWFDDGNGRLLTGKVVGENLERYLDMTVSLYFRPDGFLDFWPPSEKDRISLTAV